MNRRIKFLLCFTFAFIFAISGFFMLNGTTTQQTKAHADTTIDWSTAGSTMQPGLYDDSGNITMDWDTVKGKFSIVSSSSEKKLSFSGKTLAGNLVVGDLSSLGEFDSFFSLFANCASLKSISFTKDFDTTNVTDMRFIFRDCSSLTTLDVSHFNTENVEDLGAFFYKCSSLTTLDISNFKTSKSTTLYAMFVGCSSLTTLDLSNFDTTNVTDMTYTFEDCSSLVSLNLSSFNTSNVGNLNYMFSGCSSLKSIDISHFDVSKVEDMSAMFNGCSSLESIDLSNFNMSTKIDKMSHMFYNCSSLKSVKMPKLELSTIVSMYAMFYQCKSLVSLDASHFKVVVSQMNYMFSGCRALVDLNLSGFRSNGGARDYMLSNCYNLKKIQMPYYQGTTTYSIDLPNGMYDWNDNDKYYSSKYTINETSHTLAVDIEDALPRGWKSDLSNKTTGIGIGSDKITSITFETAGPSGYTNTGKSFYTGIEIWTTGSVSEPSTDLAFVFERKIKAPSTNSLFADLKKCESIIFKNFSTSSTNNMCLMFGNDAMLHTLDLTTFDTSNVTSMNNMFSRCSLLESINLLGFNTSNLTNMGYMFYECTSLKSIDLSSFDFSKVTNVGNMFNGYTGIIDFSKFDTTNLKTMNYMFACYKGENLDLSNLKTDSVTNVEYMFSDYAGTINLSNLDTSSMTTMKYMFAGYKGATLDLSNFNTTNVTDMSYMFYDCSALTTLNINGLDTSNVTNMAYMFNGCTLLKSLDLSSFNTTKCTNFMYMFGGLTDEGLANEIIARIKLEWGDDFPDTVNDRKSLIHYWGEMNWGISEDQELSEDEENGIWYELIDMYGYEFYDVLGPAENLETITIGNNFILSDSSNATYMFLGCANLKEIKVVDGQSNTIKIPGSINGNSMFKGCKSLPAITFEVVSARSNNSLIQTYAENTGKFSDSTEMFANCTSLEIIDLSQVTLSGSATDMFANCTALKKLVAPAALEGITSIGLPKTMYIESNSYEEIKSDILSKTDKITLTSTPSFVPSTGILLESNILELIFSALIFSFAIGTLIVVLKKSKKNMEKR